MSSENKTSTINLVVRNESFELSSNLFDQLVKYSSSSSDIFIMNKNQIYLDIDPCIFNAYLLYIQSGCFIRPDSISQEDLIDGLRRCSAPLILINHYESCDIISALSSHPYSCHSINKKKQIQYKWTNVLILIGLFLSACILSIDLYRQMLILNKNLYQETSRLLIVVIYLIDGILFFYSCINGISKFMSNNINEENRSKILINMISCLSILSYFIIQHPITNVYITNWNFLWIFIHICRTIRLVQIGSHLIDIQWCLNAIIQSFSTFFQTLIGLFWIFIISGSILYTIDMIEDNQQYSNMYLTIVSSHETLYTIGYRNNAPYGYLTRLWTIISIYLMSSLVQILIWWFQTKVTIQWKKILDKQKSIQLI